MSDFRLAPDAYDWEWQKRRDFFLARGDSLSDARKMSWYARRFRVVPVSDAIRNHVRAVKGEVIT